jgi:restriction system protein
MSSTRESSLFGSLEESPWWVSMLLAGIVYVCLKLLPWLFSVDGTLAAPAKGFQTNAALLALLFFVPALFSWLGSFERQRMFDWQAGLAAIRKMSWGEFESLCIQAFQQRGYAVEPGERLTATRGEVDFALRKGDEISLVVCRHWRSYKVGVQDLQRLHQILTSQHAACGIFVASGAYTTEALHYALGKPLVLVDAEALLDLVGTVTPGSPNSFRRKPADGDGALITGSAPRCPSCGAPMVTRAAKRGKYFGTPFWGCANFPSCRGVREP